MAFAFRLGYAATRQLVPDEAFYWVLSRHPSTGYLDHPPMVAYIIRIGTMLFGSNELGVRAGAAVLAFGTLLVLLAMCRRLIDGERATILLGVIWLCSPLFAGLSTLMTPDTPAIFFSVCAMACAVSAMIGSGELLTRPDALHWEEVPSAEADPTNSTRLWLAFGLFTGLAMVSKYTAVLPAGAVGMALLTSGEGRRQFRKPGIWLAVIVALLVFSPVIYWNATHQWASFKFQFHHGLDDAESAGDDSGGHWLRVHFVSLGKFLAGQIGFFTPVFFIFGIVVVAIRWRHYRELSPAFRILVWSATVPLLFLGFTAFRSGKPGEGNWPAFGYFPMSLLLMEHVARRWKPLDAKFLKIGCGVALGITIALHSPDLVYAGLKRIGLQDHFPRKMNDFYGWREMAASVQQARGNAPVITGRHQDAAELSFYLPGQPEVWVLPLTDEDGRLDSRPTAFDYFPNPPDLSKVKRILFFHGHTEDFCRLYDFCITGEVNGWTKLLHGRSRERRYDLCVHK